MNTRKIRPGDIIYASNYYVGELSAADFSVLIYAGCSLRKHHEDRFSTLPEYVAHYGIPLHTLSDTVDPDEISFLEEDSQYSFNQDIYFNSVLKEDFQNYSLVRDIQQVFYNQELVLPPEHYNINNVLSGINHPSIFFDSLPSRPMPDHMTRVQIIDFTPGYSEDLHHSTPDSINDSYRILHDANQAFETMAELTQLRTLVDKFPQFFESPMPDIDYMVWFKQRFMSLITPLTFSSHRYETLLPQTNPPTNQL